MHSKYYTETIISKQDFTLKKKNLFKILKLM